MTASAAPTPTDRWLACVDGMPPLEGAAGTAERLILLLHYGIDWANGWVAGYRKTYWDQILPDRLIVATYRADTLRRWWSEVAAELDSEPRNAAERQEVEALLRHEAAPVMEVVRTETEALLLRTRITTDAVRAGRT